MITAEMKEVYGEKTCNELSNMNIKFLGCLPPTTLAALIVAMTSAPDCESDADTHIKVVLVNEAWLTLESNIGVYDALKMLQPHHCGVQVVMK